MAPPQTTHAHPPVGPTISMESLMQEMRGDIKELLTGMSSVTTRIEAIGKLESEVQGLRSDVDHIKGKAAWSGSIWPIVAGIFSGIGSTFLKGHG